MADGFYYYVYLYTVDHGSVTFTDANGDVLTPSGSDTSGTYYECTTGNVTMRVVPHTNYVFKRWTSSLSGETHFSTTNPWTIVNWSHGSTVLITCELEYQQDVPSSWTLSTYTWGTISGGEQKRRHAGFNAGQAKAFSITPTVDGVLKVYSDESTGGSGGYGLWPQGYLSYHPRFDSESGQPLQILVWDSGSAGMDDFLFTYTVQAGVTYWIFVRPYSEASSGSTWLYAELTATNQNGYYIYDGSSWLHADPYVFDGTEWKKAIPCLYNDGWITGS